MLDVFSQIHEQFLLYNYVYHLFFANVSETGMIIWCGIIVFFINFQEIFYYYIFG